MLFFQCITVRFVSEKTNTSWEARRFIKIRAKAISQHANEFSELSETKFLPHNTNHGFKSSLSPYAVRLLLAVYDVFIAPLSTMKKRLLRSIWTPLYRNRSSSFILNISDEATNEEQWVSHHSTTNSHSHSMPWVYCYIWFSCCSIEKLAWTQPRII